MEADISLHSLLHDQETNDHVRFKASPDFVKECVNIIFGKDNDMFENCDDHQHKTKLEETIENLNKDKARDNININTSVHCSPDPVEIPNARVDCFSEKQSEYPKVFVGAIDGIPLYTFRSKVDKTKLEETIESLNKDKNARINDFPKVVHYCTDENLFNRLKKELEKSSIEIDEEAKKEEELMRYIVVLESIVDAFTPTYFPTRDFIKMRKTLCPDWVDQLDQIDKKTDPALNYCV